MSDDERAIRALVETWMTATKAGDIETVLGLIADDAIFMTPGQKPLGKAAFAAGSDGMKNIRFEGACDIQEIQVLGGWAYLRNYIDVTLTPSGGAPTRHAGYTLTILRKLADGRWVMTRDANLVAPA